jgi:D-alanyl-D-alanine carboxypeptidase/D-alanyl-D-alanine-endopeptidase (penicillin-binding protein 4)
VASDGGVRRAVLVTVVAVLVVVAAGVAALDLSGRLPGGLVADPSPTPTATPTLDPRRSPAPAVLVPEPTASDLAGALPTGALDAVLAAPSLGGRVGATVLDVATGQVLLDHDSATPRTPASVAKLATAAAVLQVYGPQHRFTTRVVSGAGPREVVLVGAGDASLAARASRAADLPRRASLAALADQTAAALKADATTAGAGAGPVVVHVDDSLFAGPAVSPHWPASYLASGVVAPVSALSADAGRVRPGSDQRAPDPALAAGRAFAQLLAKRGLAVAPAVTRGSAPAGTKMLAQAESPTVGELVELTLQTSDNDLAEALLRLAAIGQHQPATFAGGTAAVQDALAGLGVPTDGVALLDGSGLARASTVPPTVLGRLLLLAADGSHPELAPLLDGLPVAGFSGTLAFRFGSGAPGAAAGVVRAKTGTLTGVSALAGTTSAGGRPVVFVAMTDRVPVGATLRARQELDRFAALLSGHS